jgi:hypothetical protein
MMTTPVMYNGGVQITEGRVANAKLIDTVLFSSMVVNGNLLKQYPISLSRSAKSRTFIFKNGTNQPLTVHSIALYDSIAGNNPVSVGGGSQYAGGAMAVNAVNTLTSAVSTYGLGANVDSCQMLFGMGATLPTSGNVQVWVIETF